VVSRNIAVQKDVYDALSKEKRTNESFTSLFRRLLNQKGGLEEMFGAWDGHRPRPPADARRLSRRGRGSSR